MKKNDNNNTVNNTFLVQFVCVFIVYFVCIYCVLSV